MPQAFFLRVPVKTKDTIIKQLDFFTCAWLGSEFKITHSVL